MTFYRHSFSATARHVTQGLQRISGFEVERIGVRRCCVSRNEEPEEIEPGNGVGRQLEFLSELQLGRSFFGTSLKGKFSKDDISRLAQVDGVVLNDVGHPQIEKSDGLDVVFLSREQFAEAIPSAEQLLSKSAFTSFSEWCETATKNESDLIFYVIG